ncbi:MAG: TonB-dependent receptor [Brevundimonas sp.]|uniref:TonB-dependent receptor n=1 Tax=Brevundimonas sp. TaxID=1871086 RepID=UPI0025BDFE1A|nr:TonB-dependent receptor [Brevundimonas sp.]MBX3478526.1 TonB-dependent receptor [Brevundimonas sp.]
MTLLVLTLQAAALAVDPVTATAAAPAAVAQTQTSPTAQTVSATQDPLTYDLGEVELTTSRARGSVIGDIEPDIVLDEATLATYGASTISELLSALEPLTQSNRGRSGGQPIMLINGRRISGFREIANIPVEAIERTEILPEEVALAYGYRADQRVVNFVLKQGFRSTQVQSSVRVPTQGGKTTLTGDVGLFRIDGGARLNIDFGGTRETGLYEDERDITRDAGLPYSRLGTVTGIPFGTEIDPALSGLAGGLTTQALAPAGAASGPVGLSGFAAGAGASSPDDATAWRTLSPKRDEVRLNAAITRGLTQDINSTFRASLTDSSSLSYLGLPGVALTLPAASPYSPFAGDVAIYRYLDDANALARKVDTQALEMATVLDGFLGDWRWTFNGNYERTATDTDTGRGLDVSAFQALLDAGSPTANPFGEFEAQRRPSDTASSVNTYLSGELVFTGNPIEVPAGRTNATLKIGANRRALDSTSVRSGVTTDREQSRDTASFQGSFSLPLMNADAGVGRFGDLSLNLNAGYDELSDFGGLATLGGGLNWSPNADWSFLVSYTDEQGAPTVSQLNDPVISTPNVQVFDFVTGQSVNVTRIDGGNANLSADNRRVFKFGVNWQPLKTADLRISSDYTASRIEDQIATFPTITPDLERAFPDRFMRGTGGELLSIDARPVNFAYEERQELRTGFNFSRAFGEPNAAAMAAQQQRRPGGPGMGGGGRGPGAGGPPPGGGGGMMVVQSGPGGGHGGPGGGVRMGRQRGPAMQPGQGRFNISVYHTWRIQDDLLIRDGLPILDLLDGGSVSGRGGNPTHEIQAQAGVFKSGMGAFLNVTWKDDTHVNGGLSGQDLFFSDQTTVNLNMFADLGQRQGLVARYPWLKGARVSVGVQNLFDTRQDVTDSTGQTPLGYLPDQLDPTGRTVSINFRKLF